MTVLSARWRFYKSHKPNFTYPKIRGKKFVKLGLRSSKAMQNPFHFDEFFLKENSKIPIAIFRESNLPYFLVGFFTGFG